MNLTDAKARALKANDKPVFEGQVPGLMLVPTPISKKWTLRYVSPTTSKRRDMGLGTYPGISVAAARKAAMQERALIADGVDPIDQRKRTRAAAQRAATALTFKQAALQVHADLCPGWKNAKHAAQWISTLETYVFPAIGDLPLADIQPHDCAEALRTIWLTKPETASRTKQRMHAVFGWAWAHGQVPANPIDVILHLLPAQNGTGKEHQPAMSWRDCAGFIAANLRDRSPYETTKAALEFLILTACRSGEVRGMTWEEIDFKQRVWTIPAARMKGQERHRVPLSGRAMAILRQQREANQHKELVFPSPRGLVLSDMTLTALLRRANALSDCPGRVATAHGFRSSFRDWASEHGYPRDLAEKALAHKVSNKVEAAYHRTDLLEQRRPLMEAWAAVSVIAGRTGN